nr:hypothetical protein [Tanacetum cinerariifolium]
MGSLVYTYGMDIHLFSPRGTLFRCLNFIFSDFIVNDDRMWWIFFIFQRIIELSTPDEDEIHMLSVRLRRRKRDYDGIGENVNHEKFDFDILLLLHDIHTLACHRSGDCEKFADVVIWIGPQITIELILPNHIQVDHRDRELFDWVQHPLQ